MGNSVTINHLTLPTMLQPPDKYYTWKTYIEPLTMLGAREISDDISMLSDVDR